MKRACGLLAAISMLGASASGAPGATAISSYVISSGGGVSVGGAYTLLGVIGQPVAGVSMGGNFSVQAGFLYTIGSGACSKADVTDAAGQGGPDGQLSAQDVVTFFSDFFAGCGAGAPAPCNRADITDASGQGGPDGQLSAQDVVTFFTAFFAGCG